MRSRALACGNQRKGLMKLITKMSVPFLFFGGQLLFAALLTCSARADDSTSFIKEAMQGNNAEIQLAEVAERKSQSADVKRLAAMLQKDHQQANDKLESIAKSHGVTVDSSLDAKHEKKLERFQQMS